MNNKTNFFFFLLFFYLFVCFLFVFLYNYFVILFDYFAQQKQLKTITQTFKLMPLISLYVDYIIFRKLMTVELQRHFRFFVEN